MGRAVGRELGVQGLMQALQQPHRKPSFLIYRWLAAWPKPPGPIHGAAPIGVIGDTEVVAMACHLLGIWAGTVVDPNNPDNPQYTYEVEDLLRTYPAPPSMNLDF